MSDTPAWIRFVSGHNSVATVAERWKEQYFHQGEWGRCLAGAGGSELTHEALSKLAPTATADDVSAIIGNTTWVGNRCDGCGEYFTTVVQIGDEPDYESQTVELCRSCAASLVEHVRAWLETKP